MNSTELNNRCCHFRIKESSDPFVYSLVYVFHIRKSYFKYKLWQSINFWVKCAFKATHLQIRFCGISLEGCKYGYIHCWLHWGRHISSNIFWLICFFSGWLLQLVYPILNLPYINASFIHAFQNRNLWWGTSLWWIEWHITVMEKIILTSQSN